MVTVDYGSGTGDRLRIWLTTQFTWRMVVTIVFRLMTCYGASLLTPRYFNVFVTAGAYSYLLRVADQNRLFIIFAMAMPLPTPAMLSRACRLSR